MPELKKAVSREPSAIHEAFVKFAKKNAKVDLDVAQVAAVLRLHPHFRESDEYLGTREKLRSARAAKADAAHQRASERTQRKLARLEAEAAAARAKLEGKPAPVVKGTKAAVKATTKPKTVSKPRSAKPATPAPAPKPETPAPAPATPATGTVQRGRPQAGRQQSVTVGDAPRRGRSAAPAVDLNGEEF